ncbi:cupin domain-containing protein [Bosea sp. (in: a-proteobacteria)]|jgi:mannose-6-phosphate isomerase-like protein (cupin superfamily)|uniref:cupin domain-containing protein n=1 Tax=Bosea sp. (in: a-proteobacteria) TaxID=1871050 RepID=UPI002DDCBEB2|nr:cupin domain-containing protein [Bosea sp. (in: a-proteobacteria)]HEV2510693.1 cupin domain-containing protein [Bosea sp. (in: a-proteobacteria)]
MSLIDHETQPLEQWREGVMTLMRVSALVRSAQLCIFEQFCDPGLGAPIHLHAVEEVLEVMDGEAVVTLRGESLTLRANQSIVIPAGARHGFRNIGSGILKVRATLASPIFEASYDDRAEQSRRWIP